MTTLIVELRTLLDQVCDAGQNNSMAATMQLEDSLYMNKERMINLLDDSPQNPEHRTALQSGKALINGKEFRVNEDFIKQAIFISDQLNLDEYEAARLLLQGIGQSSTVNSTPLDTAVYLYHSEREHVLAIFNVILEATKNALFNSNVRSVFSNFIAGIVTEKTSTGSFVERIVKSTKDLSVAINEIQKFGMLESAHKIYKHQEQLEQHHNQLHNQAFLPPVQHFPSELLHLKPETTKLRIDYLNEERISLGQILYHIASLHWLPEDDLIMMLTKVQSINLADGVAPYILTAFLATISFDCPYPEGRQGVEFSKNDVFLKKMHDHITKKSWKVNTLKTAVQIQWSLFISIISSSRPSVDTALLFDKDQRLQLVKSAIALDAFGFMNNYLLYFKQEQSEDPKKKIETDDADMDTAMTLDGLIVDPDDYTKFNVFISKDFQKFVVHELDFLTQSFLHNMTELFIAFKTEAIDGEISPEKEEEINNTLTKFLTLLASIYRDRMDAGLKFWGSNNSTLYSFLGFLVDFKSPQILAATFDFFGAISTGIESAFNAHAMLKIGTNKQDIFNSNLFSWGKLFASLQYFSKLIDESSPDDAPRTFPPAEEESLCKFLYLCQQVVQYSVEARLEIWSDPLLCTHQSIISMISCPTSHRLRASLYNLLIAFCSNSGGGINDVGKKIALEVWTTLEHSDMIIPDKVMVTKPTTAADTTPTFNQPPQNSLFKMYNVEQPKASVASPKPKTSSQKLYLPEKPAGLLREFEDGKNIKSYTETLSLLNLISSLIHTPSKRDELVSGFSVISPSIPNLLGHDNNRTPGTAPYISLVVDQIFVNIKNLKFVYPDTRWQLTESCLTIIENSLMAFDIETLVDYVKYSKTATKTTNLNFSDAFKGSNTESDKSPDVIIRTALLEYITRPGYDILLRILSGGSLIREIFKIVELGKEAVITSKNERNDYFTRSMTRCLRIFLKVFRIQNAFVNVFMPQLNILAEAQSGGVFKLNQYIFPVPPPSFRSLGSLMMYNTKVIVQIALMVNCDDFAALCNLSATVLAKLASQPDDNFDKFSFPNHITIPMGGIGSKLAGILVSSPEASSIIYGFSERLQIENSELITCDDYEYDMNIIPFWLAEKTMSNIYRFDDFNDNEQHIPSTRVAILDMLLNNMAKEITSPTISEFLLGYDVKELETSGTQHKSLPTNVKHKSQLACLLSILSLINTGIDNDLDDVEEPFIRTHPLLAEKCYQLIFKLCARQSTSNATLHYLRNNTDNFLVNQFKAIACRLESCIGISEHHFIGELESSDKSNITTDYFTLVSILNQRAWLLKLVALDLLKTDSNKTVTLDLLKLLYGIEENKSHENSEEELLRDMQKMQLNLDSNYQQPLWNMLEIVNSLEFKWTDGFVEEGFLPPAVYFKDFQPKKYVIQKEGYVLYDIRSIYKVIRQVQLENPLYQNLSHVERNNMEVEMGSLLRHLMTENRNNEISFARLHCLRAWKQVVEVTIADCFDLLSFETRQKVIYDLLSVLLPKLENDTGLHVEILKGLGEVTLSLLTRLREDKRKHSIFQVGSDDSVSRLPDEKLRSVFNSIINTILRDSTTTDVRSAMYSALVNLIQYITPDKDSDDASPKNIHNQIIEIIGSGYKEPLFDIICKDASRGLNIFKTSAFKALEALYVLVRKTKNATVLSYLVKQNFLQYNIAMIDTSDSELFSIINERDVSLIPLYSHEAKMSLFIQIAMTKEGSALLLSNGIISNTSGCKFVNARFNHTKLLDADGAYKLERHGWLLTSVLMLINALLMSSGGQGENTEQFQFWVKEQSVLVDILNDQHKEPTLSSLHILHLTVSLLYQLSKQPFYFVDLENNGMAELDSLLMNLIPKYCVPKDWASVVKPSKLTEYDWPMATASETDSLLATKADAYITKIRNNLLAYAQASTFRRSLDSNPIFKPIIANTLVSIKEYVSTTLTRGASTTASLTTLVTCLSYSTKKITKVIADYEILCAQKENVGSLKYEEILEIVDRAIPKRFGIKYDGLNPSQQSQVLSTEIDYRVQLKFKEIRDLVFAIETSLFILWRHLEFYFKNHTSTTTTYSPCERYANENVVLLQQALFQTSPKVIDKLRSSCMTVLEPTIKSLEAIPSTSRYSSSLPEMFKRIRKCYA